MVALALQAPAWVSYAALGISGFSILLTSLALFLTYKRDQREKQRDQREMERDRKKVEIVSSTEVRSEAGSDVVYYCCIVTNTGVPGVEIKRVGLRSHGDAGVEIPLQPASGQEGRVLVQGASQAWETLLPARQSETSGPSRLEVVAVATDTAGDEHIQDRSKSLPIHLGN